jgi:hypothetical protein
VDFQWRVACIADPGASTQNPKDPGTSSLRSLESFDGTAKVFAGIFGAGCLGQHTVHPVASLNFRVARLWSMNNNLQYAGGVEGPTVNMWQFEPSFSTFVDDAKIVELTIGMGASVLSGDGFNSMTRLYFRPVMLTITPGGRLPRNSSAGRSVARALSVSTGIFYMPKGFDAEDFGAVPGTFHTDKELLLTAAVSLDLSRF